MDAAAIRTALQRIGFTIPASQAITIDQGIDSLDEIRYLKDSEVENLCKVIRRPGGTINNPAGEGNIPNPGESVSLRAENNLKLMAYYLRHRARVSRQTQPADITLENIRSVKELRESEENYEQPEDLPKVNDRDWPKTMEAIQEYLRTRLGEHNIPLAYVIRKEDEIPDDPDPSTNYPTVQDEMIRRAPHGKWTGDDWTPDPIYLINREKVWDIVAQITREHSSWTYVKPSQRARDGRAAFFDLYQHFLGPNNVDNMAAKAESILQTTTFKSDSRRWTFEKYVNLHKQQHSILEGLTEHGYAGIDARSKVRHLIEGIKTDKYDSVKTRILSDEALRNDFDSCVTLYTDFMKQTEAKASAPTRTIAKVNAKRKGAPTTDEVEDRYYSKEEYMSLTAEQKSKLALKRMKRGHRPGETSSTVPGKSKGEALRKSLHTTTRAVNALAKKVNSLATDETTGDDAPTKSNATVGGNRKNNALTRQKTCQSDSE